MLRNPWFTLKILVGIALLTACSPAKINPVAEASPQPASGLANPASVYCEQNGGTLEFRPDAAGSVSGVCVFPDKSECEEWAYFRAECQPGSGQPPSIPTAAMDDSANNNELARDELAPDGWKIYRDPQLGYSFHYPADASIVLNDDPLHGLTILGPMTNEENWPVIVFNHPDDREEYRPPTGVDLAQWLSDHALLPDPRQPDLEIGGVVAIHTIHERSPQSYAFDSYFFAKDGQLYSVIIMHTGDKQDWELYNHFLANIQFDS